MTSYEDWGEGGSIDLQPGEEVLWTGRPDPTVWLAPADRLSVPLGIAAIAFGVFWEHGALTDRTTDGGRRYPLFFAIWGVLILALVIWASFGQIFTRRRRLGRARYVVTNYRIVARVGRRIAETPAARPAGIWTHHGTHVTALWLSKTPPNTPRLLLLLFAKPTLARTGALVFANVADSQALVRIVAS